MAQQAQTRQYGQEQSMLAMQQRQLSDAYGFQTESFGLSEDALAQQYEREQFGASKDYERMVGSLEARQQELSPGYTSPGNPSNTEAVAPTGSTMQELLQTYV